MNTVNKYTVYDFRNVFVLWIFKKLMRVILKGKSKNYSYGWVLRFQQFY